MFLKGLLAVAILATSVFAVPAGHRSSCSVGECSANDKLFYEIGKSYEYQYVSYINTGTSDYKHNAFRPNPSISVNATVHIHAISPCEYILSLSDVNTDSSSSEKFATEVNKYTLKFSLQNGRVDSICASTSEPVWVLNFKKGILSTFQHSMKSGLTSDVVTETDVSGVCKTEYQVVQTGDKMITRKTKTPTECTKKTQMPQMTTFGFNMDTMANGIKPITSEQTCIHYISNNIIQKVSCNEKYNFKPFKQQEAGDMYTDVNTELTFVRVVVGPHIYPDTFDINTDLIYDLTELEELEDLMAAQEIISKLETASKDGVQKEVPQLFSVLVSHMKKLSKYQLDTLVTAADEKHVMKFVLDAMPLVGTTASNEYIIDLIKEGKYSEHDTAVYYTSLAFIKNPSEDMFEPLLMLLEHERKMHDKAMLGISSIVHNFCESHEECTSVYNIKRILQHFESDLGVSCRSTDEESKHQILVALKSVGNVGRWINGESILSRCFMENNPTEVKIAAIEAWRRTPCSYNRNHLLSIYEDSSYDSEIRIGAYLQVMKCPTQILVDTLKDRLTSEGVNQVSSFVWSHLNNIQESAALDKQWIRALIGEEFLKEKYTTDVMKFSRNFESSLYSKELQVGGSADAGIIFSAESFLPRSAMLNLTINLFGKSINLFEVGGRMEGYEHFFEKFFGPNGYYPDGTIEQVIKNLRNDKFEKSPELAKLIGHSGTDPKGSMFARLMGNELFYTSHLGSENILSQLGYKSPMDLIVEMFTKKNVNFMKSFNLVNAKFTVPTISGFPLLVKYDGSATVGFDLDGDFKVDDMNTFELQGRLKPSAAVTIDSSMIIDVFGKKIGRKFISTLHSSTMAEGKAIVKGLKLVDFSLNLPEKDMTIFDYSHEVIRIDGDEEQKILNHDYIDSSCYPDEGVLGIQFCDHVKIKNGFGFLSRNLIMKKMDTHTSYDFHLIRDDDKFSVMFDMPNSIENKKHKLSYQFDGANYEAELHSPYFYKTIKGIVDVKSKDKMVSFHVLDGPSKKEQFVAKFTLEKTSTKTGYMIKPTLKFFNLDQIESSIEATIANDYEKKAFEVDASSTLTCGPFYPWDVKLVWGYGENTRDVAVKISSYKKSLPYTRDNYIPYRKYLTVELVGNGKVTNNHVSLKLDGKYQLDDEDVTYINVNTEIKKEISANGTFYKVYADIPYFNVKTHNELRLFKGHYGLMSEFNMQESHWQLDTHYISKNDKDEKLVSGKIWLDAFHLDNSYGIEKWVSYDKSPENRLNALFHAAYGQQSVRSHFKYEPGKELSYMLRLPKSTSANMKVVKEVDGKILFESSLNSLSYNGEFNGVFEDQSTKNKVDWKLQVDGKRNLTRGNSFTYRADSYLNTDGEEFNFDLKVTKVMKEQRFYTGYYEDIQNIFQMTGKFTPTSLSLFSDFYRTITIDAKFLKEKEKVQIEGVATYDERVIKFMGEYSLTKASVAFTSGYRTYIFSGMIIDNGLHSILQWDRDRKIDFLVKYDNSAKQSVLMSLETPFLNARKQEIRVTYQLHKNHIESSVNIIWKNIEHFNFNGKLNWDIKSLSFFKPICSISGKVSLTSTIPNIERIELRIDHQADQLYTTTNGHVVQTNFEGVFGDSVTTANFYYNRDKLNKKVNLKFNSPFTKSFNIEFYSFKLSSTAIESTLKYEYGMEKSLFYLKYSNLIFHVEATSSTQFPPINGIVEWRKERGHFVATTNLVVNNINILQMTITEKSDKNIIAFECMGKIVHPIDGTPLSFNSQIVKDDNEMIAIDFNISPTVDTELEHRIKFHAKSNILTMSTHNINIVGHYSGHGTKASASIAHTIDKLSNEMNSQLDIKVNSFYINTFVEAFINPKLLSGSINTNIKSSIKEINEIDLTAKHELEDNVRVTLLRYKNGYHTSKLYNSCAFTDILNWNNVLIVDNFIKTTNKMSSIHGHHFKNELDWQIGEYHLVSTFDSYINGEFIAKTSLDTPYSPYIQMEATNDIIGENGIFNGKLVYEEEEITTKTTYLFVNNHIHFKHKTTSKHCSWTPFEIEFNMNTETEREIQISTAAGNMYRVEIVLFDKQDVYGGKIMLSDKQSKKVTTLEGKHSFGENEKKIAIKGMFFGQQYSANIEYVNLQDEFRLLSEINLKHFSNEAISITMTGNYNFQKNSFSANVVNGPEKYEIQGKLEDDGFSADFTTPMGAFRLTGILDFADNGLVMRIYFYGNEDYFIGVELRYRISDITDGIIIVDLNKKKYMVKGQVEDKTTSLQFYTPEDLYKLHAMVNVSEETELEIVFSKNSEEIKIKGNKKSDADKGIISLSISTPFSYAEENFISVTYKMTEQKEVKLEAKFAEKRILTSFTQLPSCSTYNQKIVLQMELPMENFEDIAIIYKNMDKLDSIENAITVHVMGKNVASAKFLTNTNKIEFALSYIDITVDGKINLTNEIDFFVKTFDGESHMDMSLTYDIARSHFNLVLHNGDFAVKFSVSGKSTISLSDVDMSLQTFKGDREITVYSGHISFGMTDQITLESIFNNNGIEYFCNFKSYFKSCHSGLIMIHMKTPFKFFDEFRVEGNYSLNSHGKTGKLTTLFNKIEKIFSANMQISNNAFSFNLETPFKIFSQFEVEGIYNSVKDNYRIMGKLNGHNTVTVEGEIVPTSSGYSVRVSVPTNNGLTEINGEISKKLINLRIIDSNKTEKFIRAEYEFDNSKVNIEIASSYPEYQKFSIHSNMNQEENGCSVTFKIQKDEFILNSSFNILLVPNNYQFRLFMETENKSYNIEFAVNTLALEKKLKINIDLDDFHHFFDGLTSFVIEKENIAVVIKAKSSLEQLKNFQIDINLLLTENEFNSKCRFSYNEYDYMIMVNTVGKEELWKINAIVEDNVDSQNLLSFEFLFNGKLNKIQSAFAIKDKVFETKIEISNELNNHHFLVSINTPYSEYEHLLLNVKYNLTGYKNFIQLDIYHNIPIVEFKAALSVDVKKPDIHLKFNSQYTNRVEIKASVNVEDTTDLVNIIFDLSDSIDYAFSFGFSCHMQHLAVSMKFKWPQQIFGNFLNFNVHIDFKFDEDRNSVNLYFENNGLVYIDVNGAYFDEGTSLSLHLPNDIIGNFHTQALYNRVKRSIEMKMMNDHHSGGIVANFHSLEINLQTPFKKLQKVSLSLTKDINRKWTLNYKRNDNYLDFEFGRTKKGIETKIDLSLPAWELLALTGRISEEDIKGYLTGKLPETKLTITGKGVLGKKKGEVKWEMNSPDFPTLKKATAKFDYNVRKGMYTFNAKSSTNKNFKVFIEFKRGGMFIDIFIPHSKTPTIAKGQLTIFKGHLNISSRFPIIKKYNLDYSVEIRKTVDIKCKVERNGVVVFNLEFHKGPDKYHFLVERRLEGVYFKFHYHRMGWHHLDLVIHRNGKEISANLKGSGQLPEKGKISFIIKNSFRYTPREVTGTLTIDRTKSPKQMVLQVERAPSDIITIIAKYNIDLKNLKTGDLNLQIDAPKEKLSKNINLEWEFDDNKNGFIKINCGHIEIKLMGKLSLKESDFVLSTNIPGMKNRVYGWKIMKNGNYRDYMVKFGPETSYTYVAVSGTARDIRNVDMKGKIKSRFAKHELIFTAKWSGNQDIGISGSGTFEIGKKKGAFKLHNLKRDPVKKASTFKLTGTSNIKGFTKYSIIGKYDVSARLIDIKIKWDNDELSLYTKIDNFTAKKSQNSATFNIPGVGPSEINFSHDFTNTLDKKIKMDGHLGGKDFHYIGHWTRNKEFTVLNLEVGIKSNFVGDIKMTADYDVRDINNASGHIVYTRNGKNNVNVDWNRTKTANSIVNEVVVDSKSKLIPSSKAYFNANWETKNFLDSSIGVQWKNKKIEAVLKIDKKMAKFYTKTPFSYIDDIIAVLKYDIQKKLKTITLNYERGQRKVNFSFDLNYKSKNKGSLDILLTTPCKIIKKLTFNVKWNKGKFDAHYQRNEKKINIAGKADISQGKSSYDFEFTPKSGNKIHIKLNYDLVDFLKKTSKKEQQIIHLEVDAGKHKLFLNIDGYSSREKLILNIEGTSSLDALKTFRLRLDSELNLSNREGSLDIKINDFEYRMKNKFEKFDNGFYFKTQIHSTLTRLPGLTLGYGKDGTVRKVTLGYGDEREISISLNGKDKFKKGLNGKIDIPRRGIMGIEYDINYDFLSDDKFSIKVELLLKNGKKINYELDYHSDGIKTRFAGPIAAIRRLRSKRSINDNLNMEDYSVTFQNRKGDNILNKGILIEGTILGGAFSIDTYLNIKDITNSQGKFIIQTPYDGLKKVGGYFTIKEEGQRLFGRGEVFFKGHASVEFTSSVLDVNSKTISGTVSYQPIGEDIPIIINIMTNIDKDKSVISITSKHSSSVYDHTVNIKIIPSKDGHHVSISYGDFQFEAEYILHTSPIFFKLHSSIHSDNTMIYECNAWVSSHHDRHQFTTEMSLYNKSHHLKTDVLYAKDIQNVVISYYKERKCYSKLTYTYTEKIKLLKFACDGEENHVLNFDLRNGNSINMIFEINSKYLPKVHISWVSSLNYFKTDAEISTGFGLLLAHIESQIRNPYDSISKTNIKFVGYSTYSLIMNKVRTPKQHEILGKFTNNIDEHFFSVKYVEVDENINLHLEVGSPLLKAKKAFIAFGISSKSNVKFNTKIFIFNVLHSIEIEANNEPKTIIMSMTSPFVPTGQGKVEIYTEGKSINNCKIELLLSNSITSYFGKITTKLDSTDDMKMEVFLLTPFVTFKEIRIGGGYKSGDIQKIYLYLLPFDYGIDFFMGNELNVYKLGFELKPLSEEILSVEALIPLNDIRPHLSVRYGSNEYDVDFVYNNTESQTEVEAIFTHNGQKNGGKVSFTKHFPLELEYVMQLKSEPIKKFHVMVDSSFLVFSNAAYLLL